MGVSLRPVSPLSMYLLCSALARPHLAGSVYSPAVLAREVVQMLPKFNSGPQDLSLRTFTNRTSYSSAMKGPRGILVSMRLCCPPPWMNVMAMVIVRRLIINPLNGFPLCPQMWIWEMHTVLQREQDHIIQRHVTTA
jgi:hypothetical protein